MTSVKTLDRLVAVLECFTPERSAWSLAELSRELRISKSTLHRFLTALEAHGILRRDPRDRRWRLGYRLLIWGSLAGEGLDLRHLARPVLEDLVARTGETAILTAYDDGEVVCIEKVETDRPVRMTLHVGTRRPPHAGASSKVLMAYLPEEEIQTVIRERGLPRLCVNTITDPDILLEELARIRRQGYAESHEETDLGAWGVATPVFDGDGRVVAAVGVAGPRSRYTPERASEFARRCREAARRLSLLLGGSPDRAPLRQRPTHPQQARGREDAEEGEKR